MNRNPWLPILAASIGWGSGVVVTRALILDGVDPWTIFLPRYVVGLVALVAGLALWGRLRARSRVEWRRGAVLGAVNMAAPTIFLTLAVEQIPASLNGILVATVPIATIVAAHVLVPGERFTPTTLPGLLVALLGVMVLIGRPGDIGEGGSLALGVFWSFSGVTAAAIGGALSRRYALETPAVGMIVPQFLVATGVVLVLDVPAGGFAGLGALTFIQWMGLLWLGLISTTVPFFAFFRAVEIAPAAKAALIGYLIPLVGVVGGLVVLGEPLSLGLAVGGPLILAGVVAAERSGSRAAATTPM